MRSASAWTSDGGTWVQGLQVAPGVVAQLKTSDGACWGATFSVPSANTAGRFKAKSD